MTRSVTVKKVRPACDFCGEEVPLRVLDYDGYAANELVCEDCFSHELAGWDDLPEAKFPEEE